MNLWKIYFNIYCRYSYLCKKFKMIWKKVYNEEILQYISISNKNVMVTSIWPLDTTRIRLNKICDMPHKEVLQKYYFKFEIYIYKIRTQVIRQYVGCTGYHGWVKSINKLFVKFLTKLVLSTADCSTPSAWNTCNWTQRQLWYSV